MPDLSRELAALSASTPAYHTGFTRPDRGFNMQQGRVEKTKQKKLSSPGLPDQPNLKCGPGKMSLEAASVILTISLTECQMTYRNMDARSICLLV